MIVILDNRDSFTFNLSQFFLELGAEVCVQRADRTDWASIQALEPAGLVLPRGPCLCLYPEQTAAFWHAHQGPGLVG